VLAIVGVVRYTSDTAHEGYERHATPQFEQNTPHEHRRSDVDQHARY